MNNGSVYFKTVRLPTNCNEALHVQYIAVLVDMVHVVLLLDFLDPALEIATLELFHVHAGDEERSLGEEIAHLLEGTPGGLGEDHPEPDGVGKVADLAS